VAFKVKIPQRQRKQARKNARFNLSHPLVKLGIAAFLAISLIFFAVFTYYYVKYDRIVEARIKGPMFGTSAKIYARSQGVAVGDRYSVDEIVSELRRAGYSEHNSKVGTYRVMPGGVEVRPGPLSYHNADGAVIRISGTKVDRITGAESGASLSAYELEPPLLTSLDAEERAKRQLVKYSDIPKVLVNAVTSIEDRKFFEHSGINYVRLVGAAWADLRSGGKSQGASTITMQISRGFFPHSAEDDQTQTDGNADCFGTGAEAHEGADLRALFQPGGYGSAWLVYYSRFCRGCPGLLQQRFAKRISS
jgi:penicillin-binding protein 1B